MPVFSVIPVIRFIDWDIVKIMGGGLFGVKIMGGGLFACYSDFTLGWL